MSEAKLYIALKIFIMFRMVINISKILADEMVMHRFTRDTFLSEAYTEHLLHNTWPILHNAFMPMYTWLSLTWFSQVSSKDCLWKNTPKSRSTLWSKRGFAEIRFSQHFNIFISDPAGKKTSLVSYSNETSVAGWTGMWGMQPMLFLSLIQKSALRLSERIITLIFVCNVFKKNHQWGQQACAMCHQTPTSRDKNFTASPPQRGAEQEFKTSHWSEDKREPQVTSRGRAVTAMSCQRCHMPAPRAEVSEPDWTGAGPDTVGCEEYG